MALRGSQKSKPKRAPRSGHVAKSHSAKLASRSLMTDISSAGNDATAAEHDASLAAQESVPGMQEKYNTAVSQVENSNDRNSWSRGLYTLLSTL